MANQFEKGDRVEWRSGSGSSQGTVQKRVTEPTEVDGNAIDASESDPRYLVENENTGKTTGHRPEALSRIENEDGGSAQSSSDQQDIRSEFDEAVNMTAKQIEDWLETDKSKAVGQDSGDGESKGRKSGRQIIEILNKKQSDYDSDDYQHMKKVVSYVHRHSAQKPSGDIEESNWRYSLMNWGHDPLKS